VGSEPADDASRLPQDLGGEAVSEPGPAAIETQPPAIPAPTPEPARQPVTTQVPTASAGSSQIISLSAGVAVPQLLPEGTQVGVSVDYSLRGSPQSSCRYLLVVESSAGEVAVPIKLDPQGGTFQGFLPPSVRPEHQPFQARIDEVSPKGERMRVSNSATLATSY
jgi:hypothetical protein